MPAPLLDPLVDEAVTAAHAAGDAGPAALLPVLQHTQLAGGALTAGRIGAAAAQLRTPESQAAGVASFYSLLSREPLIDPVVRVCDGPVCQLHGSAACHARLAAAAGGRATVLRTSCLGLCDRAPAALVGREACGPLTERALDDVLAGWRGEPPSYETSRAGEVRVALRRVGKLEVDSLVDAVSQGAYDALQHALRHEGAAVLAAIEQSGLQGRGGAGYPTGRKWRAVAETPAAVKYVVCNADESEPAAFKDRVLMEEDPHLLLEGMALAGYAVGAHEGVIYIRGEYELAARRLERAIELAVAAGLLGDGVAGSRFTFRVRVHRGAGAYICGEETALLESLEGRRGEPRLRPPYPTTYGLFGQPTVVNNVETLCKAPVIVARGAEWYRSLGDEQSPGTKVFTIVGQVAKPGVFEAPFGVTLRQVVEQFGGGMRPGGELKMCLVGGAAGTIVPPALLDTPLNYASHRAGVALGAGAVVAMDQSVRVLDLLEWLLHFFAVESCGKCTPCREGLLAALEIVRRLQRGERRGDERRRLGKLSSLLQAGSLCGLGQSAGWPLDSALRYFADELGAGEC